jgi:UDP-N-acetylglucosamine acyltransferase
MERARRLGDETDSDYVAQMVDFILSDTDRHFLTPR